MAAIYPLSALRRAKQRGSLFTFGLAVAALACSAGPEGETASPHDSGNAGSSEAATAAPRSIDRVRIQFPSARLDATDVDLVARGDGPSRKFDVLSDERSTRIEIAGLASGRTEVRESVTGVGAAFWLRGATAVDGVAHEGVVVYPSGGPGGADVLQRPSARGTEDYVVFWTRPETSELRYGLDLLDATSVRAVRDTLEILDQSGVPRIRVRRPYVIDANGARHAGTLDVEGCEVDRAPGVPWLRTAQLPLAGASCEVVVGWEKNLAYPVLVDPDWTAAAVMATERTHHAATLIGTVADPRIAVIGGFDFGGLGLDSIEIFCPAEACGGVAAFTTLGLTLATPRGAHSQTRLDLASVDRILVTGGRTVRVGGTTHASAERLDLTDLTAPTVVPTGAPLFHARHGHTATSLGVTAGGRVLVAGGEDSTVLRTAEVYNPATNLFEPDGVIGSLPQMVAHRRDHAAAALLDGRVLIAGGIGDLGLALASAEIYDPALGTFTATGSMTSQRASATATRFEGTSGNVLVAGGTNGQGFYSKTADIFVPAGLGTFQQQPVVMQAARAFHAAVQVLGEGKVLLTGGFDGTDVLDVTEIFDQQAVAFSLSSTMQRPHNSHSVTLLPSGKAVVVGGGVDGTALAPGSGGVITTSAIQAEILLLSNGEACSSDGECAAGNCWPDTGTNRICCDSECGSVCSSCRQVDKADASADGICSIVTDATPILTKCEQGVSLELQCLGGNVDAADIVLCGAYACGTAGKCRCAYSLSTPTCTGCATDAHCNTGFYCYEPNPADTVPGICLEKKVLGQVCGDSSPQPAADPNDECDSGFCRDGVCCNTACGEVCEACDVAGSEGACVQVDGPPHDTPFKAKACLGEGTECAGVCGSNPTECDYVAKECGASTCADGVTTSGECHAQADGVCGTQTDPCGDYACNAAETACVEAGACLVSENDCAVTNGAICKPNGECGVVVSPECDGFHTVISPDGTVDDCTPYLCEGAACLNRCVSIDDCVSGNVCDTSGECVEAPADPPPPEDCSASRGSAGGGSGGIGVAAVALALGLALRRRRAHAAGREGASQ